MARKPVRSKTTSSESRIAASSIDQMLLAAWAGGGDAFHTGRYIVTYKEGAGPDAPARLKSLGLRAADARDFKNQAIGMDDVGDADAIVLPEINVAVVSGAGMQSAGIAAASAMHIDGAIEAVEPELFVFPYDRPSDYLRGFMRATEAIMNGLAQDTLERPSLEVDAEAAGATWGLLACNVPASSRSGAGIKVAVLDTGLDLNHPDFAGRTIVSQSFIPGEPVPDLHSHGTHCIGTASGPRSSSGAAQRYGIAFASTIYVGKVLSNSGSGATGGVLAGMNWAIANGCEVISMSLGSRAPVQAAYTAAGQAALNRGCLIVAAAGNEGLPTGAPANSPTILSVASLDHNLAPSSFSNHTKIEIAAPGRDVYSSVPRPNLYGVKSGTSMATPHVAGCAALWAQTGPALRGVALWNRLLQAARPLPYPANRVGRGLVQAPA